MDGMSDSSRCELDSVASSESLRLFTDEFRLRHLVSPDVTNAELCKRVASLELENERLRVDAESARIEANARKASNQGLKSKIAELFVEAQTSLQEKQRLQNALKDANSRLATAENSSKWYQRKLHDSQANEKARQMEIDTYQGILRQRQQNLADMTTRCKQLNAKCGELASRFREDNRALRAELEKLRSERESCSICREGISGSIVDEASSDLVEFKLEAMEKSTEECRSRLRALEERLANSELSRNTAETSLSKYRWLMASMEQNTQKLEAERSIIDEKLRESVQETQTLRKENERLQVSVFSSEREREQVAEGIVQLRLQLNKMMAQHKLLSSRNSEAERKLTLMQDLQSENKRLKTLSYAANSSLFKKLREEKHRAKNLEDHLLREKARFHVHEERGKTMATMRDCLRKTIERNKELEERLKSKVSDESIDEGYGDSSTVSSGSPDLPSPPPFDSVLIKSANEVLSRSKNFMGPIHTSLDELTSRLAKIRDYQYTHSSDNSISLHFDNRQIDPTSSRNNARSVA